MMRKLYVPTFILLMTLLLMVACGGNEPVQPEAPAPVEQEAALSGDATAGKVSYEATCIACHGPDGTGVKGLGSDLTASEFTAGLSDVELVEFIKVGRDPSDPANTTGIAMPSKGGNPALSEQDMYNIVAYLRTIYH